MSLLNPYHWVFYTVYKYAPNPLHRKDAGVASAATSALVCLVIMGLWFGPVSLLFDTQSNSMLLFFSAIGIAVFVFNHYYFTRSARWFSIVKSYDNVTGVKRWIGLFLGTAISLFCLGMPYFAVYFFTP